MAQRIVQELKDKVPEAQFAATMSRAGETSEGTKIIKEALSALVNLGYQRSQAAQALTAAQAALGDDASVEALIKQGLRELM